ncbi:MAG: hypothetical protein AAF634_04855, partial [Bacteroidota bacterium]
SDKIKQLAKEPKILVRLFFFLENWLTIPLKYTPFATIGCKEKVVSTSFKVIHQGLRANTIFEILGISFLILSLIFFSKRRCLAARESLLLLDSQPLFILL